MGRRIEREMRVVEQMIRLYCCRKEGNKGELCEDCNALLNYALARLKKCPHGERKPSCRRCKIHCYRSDMRQRIREVMRFSGPRMLVYNPVFALKHLFR